MEGDSPSILQVEGAMKRKAEENVLFCCSYTINTPTLHSDADTSNIACSKICTSTGGYCRHNLST